MLEDDQDWIYYTKVEAHRSYMYAMSMYKHMRYGKINVYGNQNLLIKEINSNKKELEIPSDQKKRSGFDHDDKWRWFNVDQ